jgi:hypothetical protein
MTPSPSLRAERSNLVSWLCRIVVSVAGIDARYGGAATGSNLGG